MKSGRLRHRVAFQCDTAPAGSEVETWETTLKDWPSDVVPVSGNEIYRGRQMEAETRFVVETRFHESIKPTMRIVDHRARTLNIISVISKDGRDRELMIQCNEVTA